MTIFCCNVRQSANYASSVFCGKSAKIMLVLTNYSTIYQSLHPSSNHKYSRKLSKANTYSNQLRLLIGPRVHPRYLMFASDSCMVYRNTAVLQLNFFHIARCIPVWMFTDAFVYGWRVFLHQCALRLFGKVFIRESQYFSNSVLAR